MNKKWDKAFVNSQEELGVLADKALLEFENGKTTVLEFPPKEK